MSDLVFAIAAALSCGRTLNSSTAGAGGPWGVVSCRDALGAFDSKSDAWCLSNGRDIARWDSYEEAADKARRLTSSSHDDCGYEALEIPVDPVPAVTVGPIRSAVSPVRFGCLFWVSGQPVEIGDDDSAFGAAIAFVNTVGCDVAEKALEAIR